jgi:hypothetical protein
MNRKGFLVLMAVLLFMGGIAAVSAQDLIILRDGNVIESKVTEISPTEIRYKRSNHLDGPTIVVPAVNVLSIRYTNGKVDIINPIALAAPAAPAASAGTAARPPAQSAPAESAPAATASAGGTTAGNTALPGAAQTAVAIAGAAGLPGGDISSLQDVLNRLPAIPVAGKTLKFVFSGETWRAQVNGADTLSGTLNFQAAEGGGMITLKPEYAYLRGKQIRAPATNILLEYTAGPPMALRSLSKKEQKAAEAAAASAASPAAASPAASAASPAASVSIQPGPDNTVLWEGNGHKYQVVNQQIMTWDMANSYAQEGGGYLATITSKEEQDFITELLKNQSKKSSYWLGGYFESKKYQWVTGEPLEYTNWVKGQPDGKNVSMKIRIMGLRESWMPSGSRIGQWDDGGKQGQLNFIIEWNE